VYLVLVNLLLFYRTLLLSRMAVTSTMGGTRLFYLQPSSKSPGDTRRMAMPTAMVMTAKTSKIMDQPRAADIVPPPSPWGNNGWTDIKLFQALAAK
jgi:hypothetical protein